MIMHWCMSAIAGHDPKDSSTLERRTKRLHQNT